MLKTTVFETPADKKPKPHRLKLSEILAGIDEAHVAELYRQSAYVQTGSPVGNEAL